MSRHNKTEYSFTKRLKLAVRAVWWETGGFRGMLFELIIVVSFLGLLAGTVFIPFLRWIGHPPKDSQQQPVWFTILCAAVFLLALLLTALRDRKRPS